MIRVLHTIDTTGPGGAETVFVNLAKGLDSRRFDSFAAITGPGWVSDELRKKGIEPIFVQAKGGFNLQYILELGRIIREHKINLVQSHLLGSNLYSSIAGMIYHVPVVSTFHGFVDIDNRDRLMSVKSRIINLGANKIVFVSDRLREFFVSVYGYSAVKSVIIYNGIDTSVFQSRRDDSIRKELGLNTDHVLIGAIGNIRPAKGYECFLKAARLIHDRYPQCRFVIAGEGSGSLYGSLLKLRNDLNLEKVFSFLGFRDDSAKVLNNIDVFVLSSFSEGFSMSTIEAMACGIPVVVTRSGGPEEIVIDGENGIIVGLQDHVDIADAIINLIKPSMFRDKLVDSAKKTISDKFLLSRMVNEYQEIYLNILLSLEDPQLQFT